MGTFFGKIPRKITPRYGYGFWASDPNLSIPQTQGTRSKGCPKKTYVDLLKDDNGYVVNEVENSMQDRRLWRAITSARQQESTEWVSDDIADCRGHVHVGPMHARGGGALVFKGEYDARTWTYKIDHKQVFSSVFYYPKQESNASCCWVYPFQAMFLP